MPSLPSSRHAKKASGKSAKSAAPKSNKKKDNNGGSSATHASSTSAKKDAPTAAAAATAERNPKGVPPPAAVLMHALGLPLASGDASVSHHSNGTEPSNASGPSPSLAGMEVEVETRQGYTYTGKLALLDAHYNVLLHEALVRRARAFDVERAARQQQEQREARFIANSLKGSALYDPAEAADMHVSAELQDGLPRPHFIGTVALRSNNVVLVRFLDPSGSSPSPSTSGSAAASVDSAWSRLRKSFSDMSAAIKAHLLREKMRKRAARRQRLDAKKAST